MFETPNAYVCERAVGEGRTCDFRSGRTILQRSIEPGQMTKLLETGKTDLLQFVSARTRRPFSAYLVKQTDGKVGFEFEAKAPGRRGARPMRSAPLRVLGKHPRDRQPVELHAGRYGPYVKHGATNATLPDREAVDSLSLEQAVALVDEKAGRAPSGTTRRTVKTRAPRKAPEVALEAPKGAKPAARRVTAPRGGRVAKRSESATKPSTPRATASKISRTQRAPAAAKAAPSSARAPGAAAAKTKSATSRTAVAKSSAVARKRGATSKPPATPVAARKRVERTASRKTKRR